MGGGWTKESSNLFYIQLFCLYDVKDQTHQLHTSKATDTRWAAADEQREQDIAVEDVLYKSAKM